MGDGACLGICFTDHELLYAVHQPGSLRESASQGHASQGNSTQGSASQENFSQANTSQRNTHHQRPLLEIQHTGCQEFSFRIRDVLTAGDSGLFDLVATSIRRIKDRFPATEARILTPAPEECWTILPRSVYEHPSERESHIRMLMEGVPREELTVTWEPVSNTDFKLLAIRRKSSITPFEKLLKDFTHTEYFSEYEIGTLWQQLTGMSGSFMHIHCQKNYLSVSSHILGKLRGVAVIPTQTMEDLPYLWRLHASRLPWMNGIHEKIYLYGPEADSVSAMLHTQWEDAGDTVLLHSFDAMTITAPEKTVGFKLESAFPAILLSVAQ